MEMKEEAEEVMDKMKITMIQRKTGPKFTLMIQMTETKEIQVKEIVSLIERGKEREEKGKEEIMKDQEEVAITTREIATKITTIILFILMSVLTVMVSGAELVELQFHLNTDHSGTKTRVHKQWHFTRRE